LLMQPCPSARMGVQTDKQNLREWCGSQDQGVNPRREHGRAYFA